MRWIIIIQNSRGEVKPITYVDADDAAKAIEIGQSLFSI